MDEALAWHTAARRFCIEQHALWTETYSDFPPGGPYSQGAYAVFPRYRLAEETLINIERAVFDEGLGIKQAQQTLRDAGTAAFNVLSEQLKTHDAAIDALKSQLSSYFGFIENLTSTATDLVEPLPFRRVLRNDESESLWASLRDRWGIRGQGYGWFPLSGDYQPDGSLAFHEELWTARRGNQLLQRFLREQNVLRCNLLRELGPPHFELDVSLAKAVYDGSESFLFDNADWVLYTSHESSITAAGSLAEFLRATWSDVEMLAYGGPFHTDDLRGTWDWNR
jgi:hypothetical protein